ncbi:hypothetical protein AB0G02_00030 [Actinosynnema sp. NPDC023658]|uniref:hypothetical protein n=1 Tax=Actinosynnema sp. NPDC023658 TaxID=3155465 RepID=UPI00340B7AB5
MRREFLLAGVGVVLVGAVGWAVLTPSSVDVAVITSVAGDGSVEWVDAEIVRAESDSSAVRELPGSEHRHVSRPADDATIHTALGCGEPVGPRLSSGLGAVECSRDDFLAMPYPPYAPKLYFDGDGRIVEVAGRYHP